MTAGNTDLKLMSIESGTRREKIAQQEARRAEREQRRQQAIARARAEHAAAFATPLGATRLSTSERRVIRERVLCSGQRGWSLKGLA